MDNSKTNLPVTERIKTFEDACKELGEKHPFVIQYRLNSNSKEKWVYVRDLESFLKLRIVCAALNEGWEPQFTEYERRWYPCFRMRTEKELSRIRAERKADRHLSLTDNYLGDYVGFAYADSYYDHSSAYAYFGSRLCLKTNELAALDEKKSALEEKIKLGFGDAEAISYGGQTIATWKTSKPSRKFDDKAFKAEHPDIYSEFTKEVQGTRRFLLK